MEKKFILIIFSIILLFSLIFFNVIPKKTITEKSQQVIKSDQKQTEEKEPAMSIESLRKRSYPTSKIVIGETLDQGINYNKYIASYTSDGLKIYGLFTIPNTPKPKTGFPAIIFLHGYLPPKEYVTTERYIQYQDALAKMVLLHLNQT